MAILPALIVCVVIAAHALPTGWALWSTADAARSGARAEHVGGDAARAARRVVPTSRVRTEQDGVAVRVDVPSLLPGMRVRSVAATARLEPDGG